MYAEYVLHVSYYLRLLNNFFFSILTVNIMKSFLHRHYLIFFFYRVNLGCCMHEHVLVLGVDLVQMHEILNIN